MFCPKCGLHESICVCGYDNNAAEKQKVNENSKVDSAPKSKSNNTFKLKPNHKDIKKVPNQTNNDYTQGNLEFINVNTKINNNSRRPLFLFEDDFYNSEEFTIQYYKSKGYNAFFSENDPWKRLLKTLFKDIFKKFKTISKQKGYTYGFYDNEFFKICEDEINDRINYLKTIDLIEEVKKHRIRIKSKNKVLKICELVDDNQILDILYFMLQDYHNRIRGFPDLFVYNNKEYFFCEVKANTDSLSAYQVRNHEQLLSVGIDVCLFSINKSESFLKEEKWKYFNEDFYNVDDFKEKFDFKIKKANEIQNELKDNQIDKIKTKFLNDYDLCTYMGFLNLMKDYSFDKKVKTLENIDEIIINQSKKEGIKIKNLKYLSKGKYYEQRGLYSQAIEEYKNAKDFYGYNQLCICYRKNKDYENEVKLTYDAINNISGISDDCKIYFKSKVQRLTKNKKRISVYKTNNKCPICGRDEVVVVLHRKDDLKIKICDNGICYWYGGVYNYSIEDLEEVTDLDEFNVDVNLKKSLSKVSRRHRRKKQKSLFEKTSKPESDNNYTKNLKTKYELTKEGETLLNNKKYEESVEFYTKLLNHEFFINDYYPYVMLVKSYKGLNQHECEVEIIKDFFKSGRYCRKFVLKRFKKRLAELAELGYFDYSTIVELEDEFKNKGAKNLRLCRIPLPLAREIKSNKNKLKQTPLKYSPDYFDSDVELEDNISYDDKIKFKYKLIIKGEKLYKSRNYDKVIAFYTRLLTHELFIHDVYPYFELARILHKDKRYDKEVEIITKFFKSGIYCDENQISWFKQRLRRLTRYGYYDFSKFSSLQYEYDVNGALNENLSNKSVPSANEIKRIYEKK